MTPKVSLDYSSARGQGLMGRGWTLDIGMSKLSRCGRTVAEDGYSRAVKFDTEDRLCLDGVRLVVVNGLGYWDAGAEYRTQLDRFAKIVKESPSANGPAFTSWEKDGRIRRYGRTATCNGCGRTVFGDNHKEEAWLLAEVEDRHGNLIEYAYNENVNQRASEVSAAGDETEAYRPGTIWYTSNPLQGSAATRRIDFLYNSRGDAQYGWKLGTRRTSDWLVERVEVRAADPITAATPPLRVYEFDYETVSPAQRTRLKSVRTCDVDGVCQQPTSFRYQNGTVGFDAPIAVPGNAPGQVAQWNYDSHAPYVMDINSDGRSDLMYPEDGFWRIRMANPAFHYGSTAEPFLPEMNTGHSTASDVARGLPLDFDADGDHDLLLFEGPDDQGLPSGQTARWRVLISNGDGTFALHNTQALYPQLDILSDAESEPERGIWLSTHTVAGDFNGDGYPDLLTYDFDAALSYSEFWNVRLHNGGGGFSSPIGLSSIGATEYATVPPLPVDVDGDGVPEIVIPDSSNQGFGSVSFEQGAPVYRQHPRLPMPGPYETLRFANINGDGLPDALYRVGDQGSPVNVGQSLNAFVHSGSDFFSSANAGSGYVGIDEFPSDWYLALAIGLDYDRDGVGDLLMPRVSFFSGGTSNWGVLLSKKGEDYLSASGFDADGDGRPDPYFAALDLPGMPYDSYGACVGHSKDSTPATLKRAYPRPRLVDVDGDGIDDLLDIECGQFVLRRGAGVRDGLLTDVWEGIEPTTGGSSVPSYQVAYGSAGDPAVYSKAATCNGYPQQCIAPRKDLVKQLAVDTGSTSPPKTYAYSYEDWRVDVSGPGHLGFGATSVTNLSTGELTRTTLKNHVRRDGRYPHQGRKGSIVRAVTLADGAVVEESTLRLDHLITTYPKVQVVGLLREATTLTETRNGTATTLSYHSTEHDEPTWFGGVRWSETTTLTGAKRTDRELTDSPTTWVVAALSNLRTETSDSRGITISEERSNQIDMTTGTLTGFTRNPSSPPDRTTTILGRNGFGLVERVEVSDDAGNVRTQDIRYDDQQIFAVYNRNAELHEVAAAVDEWGSVLVHRDPNGIETTHQVDTFGESVLVQGPSGKKVTFEKMMAPGPGALWVEHISSPGHLDLTNTYGRRKQLVSREGTGLLDVAGRIDIAYNQFGQRASVTEPYGAGGAPTSGTSYEYDKLGRLLRVDLPNGSARTFRRDGLSTIETDARGAVSTRHYDTAGNIESVEDAKGNWTVYEYGPSGILTDVHDPLGNDTSISLDSLGRRTTIVDPDLGERRWEYNAFGEVARTWSPEHQWRTYSHDRLGRVTAVADTDGATSFDFDSFGFNGRLGRHVSPDGVTVVTTYDGTTGLPKTWSLTRVGEAPILMSAEYDAVGRVEIVSYPPANGRDFRVRYEYDSVGNVVAVFDATSGKEIWRLTESNARSKPIRMVFGNGVESTRDYYDDTGLLERISARTSGSANDDVQDLRFGYDENSNVRFRFDQLQASGTGLAETFGYDALSQVRFVRLCSSAPQLSSSGMVPALFDKTCPETLEVQYDDGGNIAERSDIGTYNYLGAQPHAVTDIGGVSYGYDDNGNQTSREQFDTIYTAFDLPRRITDNQTGDDVSFEYDALQQRVRKLSVNADSVYFGRFYRRDDAPGAPWNHPNATHRYTVFGGGEPVAEVSRTGASAENVRFIHADHLGSTSVTSDDGASGAVQLERFSYNLFGQPRDNDWSAGSAVPMAPGSSIGYTGHELDDELGLINMRGRLYDPAIGRFTTADPYVQAPYATQSLNRYSYVWNNPLSLVDPTGFQAEDGDYMDPDFDYLEPDGEHVHEFDEEGGAAGYDDYDAADAAYANGADGADEDIYIEIDQPSDPQEPASDPADSAGAGADGDRDGPEEELEDRDTADVFDGLYLLGGALTTASLARLVLNAANVVPGFAFELGNAYFLDLGVISAHSTATTGVAGLGETGVAVGAQVTALLAASFAFGALIGYGLDSLNTALNPAGLSAGDFAAERDISGVIHSGSRAEYSGPAE